jgi:hypothetical protein
MTHFSPEDLLRRELHAAAEAFEPAADGLAQIRARLGAPRPLPIAYLMVSWTTVIQPALLRFDEAFVTLGQWLGPVLRPVANALHVAAERLHPAVSKVRAVFTPRTESSGRPSRYAWLRPALAMGAVVLVAIAGGFLLSGLPRQIQQAANSILSNPAHSTKTGHNSGLTGSGQPIPSPTSGHGASPTPAPSCTPSPRSSASPKVKPSPTPSQSAPTPNPTTPSPTPTIGSSPTPSPSGTGGSLSPTPPSTSEGTGIIETSVVIIAKPAKAHPTPSPSCSG